MTKESRELLQQALRLPVQERAKLAVELIASVDGEADANAEAAWAKEIERRAENVLSGRSSGEPWEDVKARIERDILGK